MNFEKLNNLKVHARHEGLSLTKWAEEFSCYGPALEIGTFRQNQLFILQQEVQFIINLSIQ